MNLFQIGMNSFDFKFAILGHCTLMSIKYHMKYTQQRLIILYMLTV